MPEPELIEGPPGPPGPRGERGERGEPGESITGPMGPQGERGESITGPQGERGEKGDTGERGLQGERGFPGKDGIDGKPGTNGIDGRPGERGTDGVPGRDGIDGQPGRDGRDGTPGITPEFSVGTVSTVDSGIPAQVTIDGTADKPVLNFRIPRGMRGLQGEQGWGGGGGGGDSHAIVSLSSNATLTVRTSFITGGTSYALPTNPAGGNQYRVTNVSGSTIAITSAAGIGNAVSGNPTSFTLYAQESLDMIFDGTLWRIV